jgi:hypothetical protein
MVTSYVFPCARPYPRDSFEEFMYVAFEEFMYVGKVALIMACLMVSIWQSQQKRTSRLNSPKLHIYEK